MQSATVAYMKILYASILAALTAMLTLEALTADWWRTAGFLLVLVCALVVRDDFTRTTP